MALLYEQVFAKSVEKKVTATKIPTRVKIYLQIDHTDISGTTQRVGTAITIRSVLEYQGTDGVWRWLSNKNINVYHQLDTGTWEKIGSPKQGSPGAYADLSYTLNKAGTHTFYSEFPGDATYAGCSKAVKSFAR